VAKVDQVSFSIVGRVRARQQSCATRENPARFNIGTGAPGLGILVRPTNGDIDVFLSQGGNVVDASLHKSRLSELKPQDRIHQFAVDQRDFIAERKPS
jgi:hypothetical protein